MTKIIHLVFINLVTPKARAKSGSLFTKPASAHKFGATKFNTMTLNIITLSITI
jgi:hypothetical protein